VLILSLGSFFASSIVQASGESYRVIGGVLAAKLLVGVVCLLLSSYQSAVLFFIVANRNLTECNCRLSALVLSDLVDEDYVRNRRSKPMSSTISGLHALVSRPAQSLAPMLSWWLLRRSGLTAGGIGAQPAAAVSAATRLLFGVPMAVSVLQAILWSQYRLRGPELARMKRRRVEQRKSKQYIV